MKSFIEWLKKFENYGGSAGSPSSADEEGDGGERLSRNLEKPGAFPTYGDDLPITKKNRKNRRRS
jgi:hypothetical protein